MSVDTWVRAICGWALVPSLLAKITCVLAAGWFLGVWLRRGNPRWRALIWRGTAVGVVVLPLLAALLPAATLAILPQRDKKTLDANRYEGRMAMPGAAMRFSVPASGGYAVAPGGEAAIAPPKPSLPPLSVRIRRWLSGHTGFLLAALWGTVVAAFAVGGARTWGRFGRVLRRASPVPPGAKALCRKIAGDLGSRCVPRLVLSREIHSPLLAGVRKPVIVIPEEMARPDQAEALRAVLAHEIAHLKSADLFWARFLQIVSALLWFHPLAWGIPRAHTAACEEVSDAVAAGYTGNADAYAGTLARVALETLRGRQALGGIPMARKPEIMERLRMLKRRIYSSPLRRGWMIAAFLGGALALAILGAVRLTVQAQAPSQDVYAAKTASASGSPSDSLPPGSRVLHFPTNRSLGEVWIRNSAVDRRIESFYYWIRMDESEYLCAAQGDVVIPPGKRASLGVRQTSAADLTPLSQLAPDDLYGLGVFGPVDDSCLPHIAALKGLRELSLSDTRIGEEGLKSLLRHLPSLEYLRPPACLTDSGMAVVGSLRQLKGFYLNENGITNAGLAHLANLTNLEELELGGKQIGDAGLVHLAKLPKLYYLLPWGGNFSDAGMVHLKRVPSLRILNLMHLPITDAGAAHLAELGGVENLSLWDSQITDAGLAHLKRMRSLKKLDIGKLSGNFSQDGRPLISDAGAAHLKEIKSLEYLRASGLGFTDKGLASLSELPNLRTLMIMTIEYIAPNKENLYRYTDEGLKSLSTMPKLEELSISSPVITDEGLAHLQKLGQLRKLAVKVRQLTDKSLELLSGIKTLQELELGLSRARNITVEGLNHLNSLTNLKKLSVPGAEQDNAGLDFSGLTQLEELTFFGFAPDMADMNALDLAWLPKLTRLKKLGGLSGVNDASMAYLAGLTNLESLGIGGPKVTDAGLVHLVGLPKLQVLILTGDITEDGLKYLENKNRLINLGIQYVGEPKISPEARARFQRKLPSLHLFNYSERPAPRRRKPDPKPADLVTKPADMIAKPADLVAKPADPIAKPADPIAKPADLIGKPLPDLAPLGVDPSVLKADGKMVLVCFWDVEQRGSRFCVLELAKMAENLSRQGVQVVAVHASKMDEGVLRTWKTKERIPFPLGMVRDDAAKVAWRVGGLPWLLLTDRGGLVRAVGFPLSELSVKIAEAKGR